MVASPVRELPHFVFEQLYSVSTREPPQSQLGAEPLQAALTFWVKIKKKKRKERKIKGRKTFFFIILF